jgi:hypothetical protein
MRLVHLGIRVTEKQSERLKEIAMREEISVSVVVRRLINELLRAHA